MANFAVGKILNPEQHGSRAYFEWKVRIPDLFSTSTSPYIVLLGTDWYLQVIRINRERIGLNLWRWSNLEKTYRYSLGFKTADCTNKIVIADHEFPGESVMSNHDYFLEIFDPMRLNSPIFPSNMVTFTCSVWKDGASSEEDKGMVSHETQTDDLSDTSEQKKPNELLDAKGVINLQKHLKDFFLSGDDHDVTIKVKNREFRAHKGMLCARSPVFAAMFRHGMKESIDDSISIDDCEPEAFGEFLLYLYTSKVENWSPSNAMALYYAGDKYDFPVLKDMCIEFLKTSPSTEEISDVITFAIKHREEELLSCAMAFFSKRMEEIMITVRWQRFLQDNPIQANEMCLKALKTGYRKIE